jgi:putative autotransporter adhesin-like protein
MNENTNGHVSESKVRPFRILTTEGMFLMKKIATISLAACVVLTAGCRWIGIRGNGNVKTEERTIGAFANIDASGVFTIEWQNGAPTLRITIDENLLPYINNHISGDTLRLRVREQIWPTHAIKVVVSSPTRAGARISGAVRLTAKQLNGPKFAFEARGASHVALDGKIDELLADMTGASELEAGGLQTKTVEISTTGAGEAEIAVSDTLKVAITGAGKVSYSGNPKTIEKHISGAGSIRHKE